MNAQIIVTPTGERLVLLPEAEYNALVEASEDADDVHAVRAFNRRLAAGEEELVPSAVVDRMIAGESPIRVWREHRGLTARDLAGKAAISAAYLSELETGKKDGSVSAIKKIADALGVTIDDLI
jgi:DNA-binding Xre family transcriptional regulator